MKNKNKKMALKTETIAKLLSVRDLKVAAGGRPHGTGTDTGLCPKDSVNCPKPN